MLDEPVNPQAVTHNPSTGIKQPDTFHIEAGKPPLSVNIEIAPW